MNCEFCNNIFSTKYVLNNHQKRAKYCIELQKSRGCEVTVDLYKCEHCSLEMAVENKMRHLNNCKIKYKNIITTQAKKISDLEKELDKLQAKLEIYKELSDRELSCVEDIAKQPRNQVNTQTNNLMMMTPMDISQECFASSIQTNFTKDYLLDGQKGAARFAVDNLLKDANGDLKYICTDPSRQIYRFKTLTGELERDVKAKKLTRALCANLTKKSHAISASEMEGCDADVFVVYTSNFQDIRDLEEDNGEFRSELASLTTI